MNKCSRPLFFPYYSREQEIKELLALVKTLQLQKDRQLVNGAEFAICMHLIVCRTKRGLPALPLEFPRYLFPQLEGQLWSNGTAALAREDLNSEKHPFDLVASMGSAFAASTTIPEKLMNSTALHELTHAQVKL